MLEEIVERAKTLIDYKEQVKIKVKPLKTSIARVSFKYNTITIDPAVLELNEEEILYIIVHELAHLKSRTEYHSLSFWQEVEKVFPKTKASELEARIFEKLNQRRETF